MKLVTEQDIDKLKCPYCKDKFLVIDVFMYWD